MSSQFFSFSVKAADGSTHSLNEYQGKVILVVNVASRCGLTPQYKGLEELYEKYSEQGLVILGFPCNQFGAQEPGTMAEIQEFCTLNFGVKFPIMGKIEVNGGGTDPLYKWLKESAPGILGSEAIKWNFTKFLIGRTGEVLERFAPTTEPKDLEPQILAALNNKK